MKIKDLAVAVLVTSLALGAVPARAQEKTQVVDRAGLEDALAQRAQSDEASRDSIRTLLAREDIQAMAGGMGLDVKRASGAVATLQGAELKDVAGRAAMANDLLTGGRTTITISLVAILLIIIIVILLAN